jgi:hypothetical protein
MAVEDPVEINPPAVPGSGPWMRTIDVMPQQATPSTVKQEVVTLADSAGNFLGTISNPFGVSIPIGVVDANNTTTSLLLANATFTGTATSVLGYSVVEVIVYSDQASSAGGLLIEFSSDGTNWDDSSPSTFTPGSAGPNQGQVFMAGVRAQYMRVSYTNGTTNQATFRLQTVLKINVVGGDVLSLNSTPRANQHAMLTMAQIVGASTAGGGVFVPIQASPSGAAQIGGSVGTQTTSGPVVGQATWTSGAAVAIVGGSNPVTNGVLVQGLVGNTGAYVEVGASGLTLGHGYQLQPGQAVPFTCSDADEIYVIGLTSGDGVCWNVL